MKTINIETFKHDKDWIQISSNFNRTKQNTDGLLFSVTIKKEGIDDKILNRFISAVISSMALCDKYNINTGKEFSRAKKHFNIDAKYFILKKEKEKYFDKENIKLNLNDLKFPSYKLKIL